MSGIKQASEFGAYMGYLAVKQAEGGILDKAKGTLIGAGLGAGGTALYDYITGAENNRLTRALLGAGAGGSAGAAYDLLSGLGSGEVKDKEAPKAPTDVPRVAGVDATAPFALGGAAAGGFAGNRLGSMIGKKYPAYGSSKAGQLANLLLTLTGGLSGAFGAARASKNMMDK
jgi:hypothetical protein